MFIFMYASSRVKRKSFYRKVNSRCFWWFPAAILAHQNCAPIWRLHTKLYKGAWNVPANNSETVGHRDLRLGKIVYILVFCNISFSWLLPLNGFQFIFFVAWQWKRSIAYIRDYPPVGGGGGEIRVEKVSCHFLLFMYVHWASWREWAMYRLAAFVLNYCSQSLFLTFVCVDDVYFTVDWWSNNYGIYILY